MTVRSASALLAIGLLVAMVAAPSSSACPQPADTCRSEVSTSEPVADRSAPESVSQTYGPYAQGVTVSVKVWSSSTTGLTVSAQGDLGATASASAQFYLLFTVQTDPSVNPDTPIVIRSQVGGASSTIAWLPYGPSNQTVPAGQPPMGQFTYVPHNDPSYMASRLGTKTASTPQIYWSYPFNVAAGTKAFDIPVVVTFNPETQSQYSEIHTLAASIPGVGPVLDTGAIFGFLAGCIVGAIVYSLVTHRRRLP
jgi:hypothetical protein